MASKGSSTIAIPNTESAIPTDSTRDTSILTSYKDYLIADGKGIKTTNSYIGDIRGFLLWLETKNVDFKGNLARFYITTYREDLVDQGYSINTINKKINSLHSFNIYLISLGLCSEKVVYPNKDKIKVARGSEGEVVVLTEEEIGKLLFYLEDRSKVTTRKSKFISIFPF